MDFPAESLSINSVTSNLIFAYVSVSGGDSLAVLRPAKAIVRFSGRLEDFDEKSGTALHGHGDRRSCGSNLPPTRATLYHANMSATSAQPALKRSCLDPDSLHPQGGTVRLKRLGEFRRHHRISPQAAPGE